MFNFDLKKPGTLFCIGWAIVMLALTMSLPPVWNTFIHMWRVEFVASIFLFATVAFAIASAIYLQNEQQPVLNISRDELNFIVLPVVVFVLWSALSIIWAPSWKSALHHTLVWCEYLIFYIAVRQLLNRKGNYAKLATMLALTLSFFGALSVAEYCIYLFFGSGTSIGIIYAKYGEQANAIFPLLAVGVLRLSGKRFKYGTAILTLLWLLIFCSLSRANLILFAVASVATVITVFSLKQFHGYRRKLVFIGLCFIITPIPFHAISLFANKSGIPILERVGNEAGISSSNNFRKLMVSIAAEMFAAHPIIGVGADNFGFETNKYRALYAVKNPDDSNLAQAESDIPERAHNEILQIAAELGIVGIVIVLWLLAGIVLMAFRSLRRIRMASLHSLAALLGIAIFLVSSLVTSYSFRLIQNGFVFFFVLAVASKLLLKNKTSESNDKPLEFTRLRLRYAYSAGMIASLLLTAYCTVRVASVVYETNATRTQNLDEAIPLYQTAMRLDDENPEPRYFLGLRLIEKGRYRDAVPFLEDSIRIGKARSADFSYLATAQTLVGDNAGAERTFSEAAALYPRSPFVLTRYAALLQVNGKTTESAAQLERARQIDVKQANTWWVLITTGPQAATDLAVTRSDFASVMELQPLMAMYAVTAERGIRFPEEKFKF